MSTPLFTVSAHTPNEVIVTPEIVPTTVPVSGPASIQPIALGNIIQNAKTRKTIWAIYGVLGLGIIGFVGGLQAINALAPQWFMFLLGAYAALGPAFSSLAVANISTTSKE